MFDHCKNNECHCWEANKENDGEFELTKSTDNTLSLLKYWQEFADDGNTQYCNGLSYVTASVVDHTWNVHIGDKKVPKTCQLWPKFSPHTSSLDVLIKSEDEAVLI